LQTLSPEKISRKEAKRNKISTSSVIFSTAALSPYGQYRLTERHGRFVQMEDKMLRSMDTPMVHYAMSATLLSAIIVTMAMLVIGAG
jgi:hypothetical protein